MIDSYRDCSTGRTTNGPAVFVLHSIAPAERLKPLLNGPGLGRDADYLMLTGSGTPQLLYPRDSCLPQGLDPRLDLLFQSLNLSL